MSDEERYGTDSEKINPVWHPDESTVWQQAGADPVSKRTEYAAFEFPESGTFQSDNRESDFSDTARDIPDEAPAAPPKKKNKGHFWKRAGLVLAGIMLIFSTVTSAYLLYGEISARTAIPQLTQSSDSQFGAEKSSSDKATLSVSEINEKVSPSVVLITGSSMAGSGQGTGVIVSENGYIMTNAHVVSGFSELTVTLNDEAKTEYPATVSGIDTATDLAVIKINASGLVAAELGTSADLKVGENVVVIGNPLGQEFSGSVTTGIISALDREVQFDDGQVYCYIQTDAAINSGNSGGPLVNMQGLIIGINSAKIDSAVAEGMGFAIPIDDAIPVVNDLMEFGYVKNRPFIGISGESLGEQYIQFYDLPSGVHVLSVDENSPASEAGIHVDDIITSIDGTEVSTIGELNHVKNKYVPGDVIELKIYRYSTKEELTVKVTLAEMSQDVQ